MQLYLEVEVRKQQLIKLLHRMGLYCSNNNMNVIKIKKKAQYFPIGKTNGMKEENTTQGSNFSIFYLWYRILFHIKLQHEIPREDEMMQWMHLKLYVLSLAKVYCFYYAVGSGCSVDRY
jgi:hypothetical protein